MQLNKPSLLTMTAFLHILFVFARVNSLTAEERSYLDILDENEVNVPLRISFCYVDQFGQPASNITCQLFINSYKKITATGLGRGGPKTVMVPSSKSDEKTTLTANNDGIIVYEGDNGLRCAGGSIIFSDKRFMRAEGYSDAYMFSLSEFFDKKFKHLMGNKMRHVFNPSEPEVIHVWRRIGFKPLVCYDNRNNELDLTSAAGEVRFDLTTFQPVENGGDIILKWEIGDATPPEVVVWMKRPSQWGRQLHYTITAVDGRVWSVNDDRQWLSIHGVVPNSLPSGQPEVDKMTTLPAGGRPEQQRLLLVARNDKLCGKVVLAFSLRDALKGLVRVNFAGTVVNPAGPPSLEIQPSDERDYLEGDARQQITTINQKLRGIGSGPLPSPGPTDDVAWATYEKVCEERGIKPIPRPSTK